MSSPTASDETLVESKSQLIDYIASGEKPQTDWRIGTEHEKFLFCTDSHRPLAYEGRPGVKGLLEALSGPEWEPVLENGNIIALKGADGASVSLEPGGQFELSGAPLENVHQTCAEVHRHLDQVVAACKEVGAGTGGKCGVR